MGIVHHKVAMVEQGATPLCWAACALMIMQYRKKKSLPENVIGNELEVRMGSRNGYKHNQDIYKALRLFGFRVMRSDQINVPGLNDSSKLKPERDDSHVIARIIEYLLRNFGPVMLFHRTNEIVYEKNIRTGDGGHAVVLTGIDTNTKKIYLNNPWGTRDILDDKKVIGSMKVSNTTTSISSIMKAVSGWEDYGSELSLAYLP